jgi:RimJ/RimL family protein N-acetyltransferase
MSIFLDTERLVLRQFTEADVDNLVELDSDPDVMRFLGGGPTSRAFIQDEMLPNWLRYYERYAGYGFWAAIEKSTGDFLGWFHFRPEHGGSAEEAELGYRIRKSAWNKGYATEASRALIRTGFTNFGVQRVVASTAIDNLGSRRVMEKSGLRLVGMIWRSRPDIFDGQRIPSAEYALDKADWHPET